MIDALRHAARAQLSSFAGGANAAMDESIWADTPYSESELQAAVRPRRRALRAARAYRSKRTSTTTSPASTSSSPRPAPNPTKLPGEYNLIDPSQSICLPGHQWKVTDVIAIASLVAGIFGKGGGGELGARAVPRGGPAAVRREHGQEGLGGLPVVQRPRGADHRPREELPVRPAARPARRGSPCPIRARVQPANVVQSASGQRRASARPRASRRAPGRDPEARSSSTTAPPTRCSSRRASRRAATPSP